MTSRLLDPWSNVGRMRVRVRDSMSELEFQVGRYSIGCIDSDIPINILDSTIIPKMASASDKPSVISIHTPSSSIALVHSGMIASHFIAVVIRSSLSYPFLSYYRLADVAFRQAQQKEKYRILWETRWPWMAEIRMEQLRLESG